MNSSCQESATLVSTHFRITIPSGQSVFTVDVPKNYLLDGRRRFYFDQLHLTPSFFSEEAEKLDLDADPEMDRTIERSLDVKIVYDNPKDIYGKAMDHSPQTMDTTDFIIKFNSFFENKRPPFAVATPLFIDWIDRTLHDSKEPNDYVVQNAKLYYGVGYSAMQHTDFLASSARTIPDTNNFLPPLTGAMNLDEYDQRISLRLWIGPYTKAVFSNVNIFVADLGFKLDQLGVSVGRQIHLTNDTPYWRPMATATTAPNLSISKLPIKVTAMPVTSPLLQKLSLPTMKQRQWKNTAELAPALIDFFHRLSQSFNLKLSLAYNTDDKKFVLTFPDATNVTVYLNCEPEFSHRLGFGYQSVIIKGMKAQAQKTATPGANNGSDAQKKSTVLVYDTGPIICSLEQMSSNTTSGSIFQTMASLYPRSSGTLSMPTSTLVAISSAFPLAITSHSAKRGYVPVTFRLSRIYDNQSTSDFVWTCDANVFGVLVGFCPPHPILAAATAFSSYK
jgi:hypothetical protein